MLVGVPKEIKDNEYRVSMTPASVAEFVRAGHQVFIEKSAGVGSGITDEEFIAAGAEVVDTAQEVYSKAEMIVKVKEPVPSEYDLLQEGVILFTYLHLAADEELTKMLMRKRVISVAYETIQLDDGSLPLLAPMSEVAGRLAVQTGARFLEKMNGGKGILLAGVPGVPPAEVVIIGGGTVGLNAARIARGMGAHVTIIEKCPARLRFLDDYFQGAVTTLTSNSYNIAAAVKKADLLIGAVLIPGAKAPKLVTEEMVKEMAPGSVIVDVDVDQGGCIETIDHPTSHANPTYEKHGVIHYAVTNMAGCVARTSTYALTDATLPYGLLLANKGYQVAPRENSALAKGYNVVNGKITYRAVAEAFNLPYSPLEEIIGIIL